MADRPFQPGSACKGGKLYLFSAFDVLVVQPWPDPAAWRLGYEGGWKGARPLRLELDAPERWAALPAVHGLRERQLRLLRNQAAAFELVPRAQRLEAARFGERAWGMHVLFSRVPGSVDLAAIHPALALGLACPSSVRPRVSRPLRSARALLAKPGPGTARRVAGWLGFEASRAVVRILRKLRHDQCVPWVLALLQRALARPDLHKLLCYLPAFEAPVFTLLTLLLEPDLPVVEANGLALELSAAGPGPGFEATCLLFEAAFAWNAAFPGKPMPALRSLALLEQLHLDARVKLGAPLYQWGGRRQLFPPPPVVGIDTPLVRIDPLSSPALLRQEGAAMGHCVGNPKHIEQAGCGRGYGYSIRLRLGNHEQRGTAWLALESDRTVRLASLRGPRNIAPSAELLMAAEAWIAAHNEAALGGLLPPLEYAGIEPSPGVDTRWARDWRALGPPPRLSGTSGADGEGEIEDMPF